MLNKTSMFLKANFLLELSFLFLYICRTIGIGIETRGVKSDTGTRGRQEVRVSKQEQFEESCAHC